MVYLVVAFIVNIAIFAGEYTTGFERVSIIMHFLVILPESILATFLDIEVYKRMDSKLDGTEGTKEVSKLKEDGSKSESVRKEGEENNSSSIVSHSSNDKDDGVKERLEGDYGSTANYGSTGGQSGNYF